jgi:anthraniloyl-CoA monooxygenase
VAELHTVRNERWHHGTSCSSATPRTPRTSRSGRARSSRWRTRSPGACLHEHADVETALAAYEDRARPVVRVDAARGAGVLEWFENSACTSPGARAVLLQPADPQPPHHLRQPAHPRPRVRRSGRRGFAPRSGSDGGPADVPAVPARELALQNRVVVSPMDMYSRVDGVPATSTSSTSGQGDRRRRARDDGDGLRVPDGRITPAAPVCTRRAARPWAADRRLRPRAHGARIGCSSATPAQGLHRADVGGHGRAAADGNWEVSARRRCRTARTQPVPRELTRADMDAVRERLRRAPPRAAPSAASTCSNCTARTATCCPRSCRRSPTTAPTNTAGRLRTACATRSRCSTPAARVAGRAPDGRAHLRDRLGADGNDRARRRRDRPRVLAHGADAVDVSTGQVDRDGAPRSAARTRPRSPTGSARGRAARTRHRGRARSRVYDDVNSILLAGGPTCARSAAPTSTIHSGHCTPRGAGVPRRVARAVPGRVAQAADGPHRRRAPAPVPAAAERDGCRAGGARALAPGDGGAA